MRLLRLFVLNKLETPRHVYDTQNSFPCSGPRARNQLSQTSRGGLVERSFAHCYETGGLRRRHLRGRDNILKRQLVHVGAFNLSLILRQVLARARRES
jgi:hypothetical protein